jgi:hypothetical protein
VRQRFAVFVNLDSFGITNRGDWIVPQELKTTFDVLRGKEIIVRHP